ncbi:HrpE/YscL family type III secretion apparatus protein [Castellaniella defragrans]|uniref:Type 3 secretion system stator protein n=1 Tax=Castellaniella defragrans TaxID=75697 RepID=A0A7W9WQJ1_CASDE|nr:HrpE/YscL family type III secretion apparatus protein [Castellaniella defragrans]KAB0596020.1 HrpE/YscL family type III secretion apparatus protein [Castellaniella defragrans]MBB6084950.1 type III secretion protein L [Castellaniella defragrans]
MAFLVSRDALNPRTLTAAPEPGARVLRAADHAALVQAEDLLAQARAQADAILAGAQEAFEAERRRGYEDGRQEALLDQAEKMIETVSRTVDYFAGVENEMVDLVMAAVRKVVDGFDDREKVMVVVRNALAVVRNQKQMTLRLHPDDVEVVRARINDILAAYPGVGYLDLLPDARLARGACILESEIGMVEASLEGQIEAVRRAFQRTLGSRV